jgi:hypothetical protein
MRLESDSPGAAKSSTTSAVAVLPEIPVAAPKAQGGVVGAGYSADPPPSPSGGAPPEGEMLPAPQALSGSAPAALEVPPVESAGAPHPACGVNGPWPPPNDCPGLCGWLKGCLSDPAARGATGPWPPPKGYPGLCGHAKVWWGQCVGSPQDYNPPPFGAVVYASYAPAVANGDAAHLVLYRFDFECASQALNLHGHDRLVLMAPLLLRTPFPLIIERTPDAPALAEARRLVVLNELAAAGVSIPPQRVVVGPAPAVGLSGLEAAIIYQNLLQQTEHAPTSPGLSGGTIGGAGRMGGTTPGPSTGTAPSTGGAP